MQLIPPQIPENLRYIAIEGVIGVGKTTLANAITKQFGARLVLEEFEENPFLERFYDDRSRWGFHTQLNFLASRFRQQKALENRDLFQQVVVSDYIFDKDRIFAHVNLNGDELQLYESLYGIMEQSVATPDLVVYLQSTNERLLYNIALRGRSYEQAIEPDYIATLNEAYNRYFYHFSKCPLLIINAARLDFVKYPLHLQELIRQIVLEQHTGTRFFNPNIEAAPALF
ncbi:MAG TPA: deoxynucleoside kinase [Rhodothermales bacterium]|nr:deoxynucleoside kinase [Rhodothermales bacterium]